ncbi:uncharacterized protein EI90DRAFT_3114558 [Cantharellus anzutake]|uniref:uncharacterized protein n=1 Tax=Cantharellus anzutake TaxID=1750568 RepID=UPI0019037C49|nr:uncharacterized protein EI90DRAFT_3114558 [Cantharellus anzutake]KAF8343918.1 hypothetical protein EI90DRAFT_3114558 [Cantharellus anzutake]
MSDPMKTTKPLTPGIDELDSVLPLDLQPADPVPIPAISGQSSPATGEFTQSQVDYSSNKPQYMGQNYAPEMMAPMQAPPYPMFAPGMWGYNPHMQQEPVRPPIAASNDSILGDLLKEASQRVHLLEGKLSRSRNKANNLRNENKELRENFHRLEIEKFFLSPIMALRQVQQP